MSAQLKSVWVLNRFFVLISHQCYWAFEYHLMKSLSQASQIWHLKMIMFL